MKKNSEIVERMNKLLAVIVACGRDCAMKPPGFYCGMCSELMARYAELEWVISKEGDLEKKLKAMREA